MRDGKHLILCIDDDPDILDNLQLILEANGYAVVSARTGEEGLRIYKKERPDLIIVDLMMEEIDAGTSFVKELQALGDPPPVYMLSSVGDHLNLAADYAEFGLAGILQKPVAPEALLKIVETSLDFD